MSAALALGAILGITLRQIRRARRTLNSILAGDQTCDINWCACNLGDDDGLLPCRSTITFGGVKTCTLPGGHDGMHEHGGWAWTDGIAAEDAA